MFYIAHRGNVNGPHEDENNPDYVAKALASGYDAEVDLWVDEEFKLWLGHDKPQYRTSVKFFNTYIDRLWIHCKNPQAMSQMMYWTRSKNISPNFFWHNTDDYTLTSYGYIWTYPGKKLTGNRSIAVMPESADINVKDLMNATGICTDQVELFRFSVEHYR